MASDTIGGKPREYYSKEAIRQRAAERKTQRQLESAYSGMSAEDKAASQEYYSGQMAGIDSGTGTDEEKAAAKKALLEQQIANPYATGDSAYDQYANVLLAGYNQQKKALGNASGSAEEALQRQMELAITQMERQRPEVEESYQDAQRQAYIQQMQAKKNIGQQLSAMGLNGGAAESSLLDLENNYGSQRAAYTRDRDKAMRDIDNQIGDARAQAAIQAAQLEAQYEQALAELVGNFGNSLASAKLQAQLGALDAETAAKQLEADLEQQEWERAFKIQEADRDWQLALDNLAWQKEKYGASQTPQTPAGNTGGNDFDIPTDDDDLNEGQETSVLLTPEQLAAYNGSANNMRGVLQRNGSGEEIAAYLLNQFKAGNLTMDQAAVLASQYGAADVLDRMLQ